ncbi:MAG TPA: hypothetical protein PLK06_01150 [bacterium]|nr:hypothetical protein [bacterium]
MFQEKIFSTLAVVAVIVITAGFFIAAEPEESSITTEDGVVTITGLARQTQPLVVNQTETVRAPLFGTAYSVKPDEVTLDEAAVVAFRITPEDRESVADLGIYRFHQSLQMWELVAPVVAHTDEVIAVEARQLGLFAVGLAPEFEAPVFANVYDELRSQAPADAVGYEIAVGYAEPEHEILRLLSLGEHGGCGGAVRVGDGESLSRLDRDATVKIQDVERQVTFTFVTRWFTSSMGGCDAQAPLSPLVEYDILDAIQI